MSVFKNYTFQFLSLVILFNCAVLPVFAQEGGMLPGETFEQPKERPVEVTATVVDPLPPSTPVLIAPADESLLSTNLPTFKWYASYDAQGIGHYQLYLDGELYIDFIPTVTSTTEAYSLTYDSEEDSYSLTVNSPIPDGLHTWKIRAYDKLDKGADSVTWSFSIDSLIPDLLINSIGAESVLITSQDLSTIPTEPVILSVNSPLFKGTGEPNATVQVTVLYGGSSVVSDVFTIGADGTWQLQIGILPRNEIVYFSFQTSDEAGHISILENIPVLISPFVFVPPQLPSPLPELPTIEIPEILNPAEGRTIIFRNIIEQTPPSLQETVRVFLEPSITQKLPESRIDPQWLQALLLPLLIVVTQVALVLRLLNDGIRWRYIGQALRLIAILPSRPLQGILHTARHQYPVGYQRLVFVGKNDAKQPVQIAVLTNAAGMYEQIGLSDGVYEAGTSSEKFMYPTAVTRHPHIRWYNWYRDETFRISKEEPEPSLSLPVDSKQPKVKKPKLAYGLVPFYSMRMFGIIALVLAITANYLHAITLAVVALGTIYKKLTQKNTTAFLIHSKNERLQNAVVKVFKDTQLVGIGQSDKRGIAKVPKIDKDETVRIEVLYRGYSTLPDQLSETMELTITDSAHTIELFDLL